MSRDAIRFRGSYRYPDLETLERALARARAELDEENLRNEGGWPRCFVRKGTELTVDLTVPSHPALRFVAANVFLILAHGAVDGSVEAIEGERCVDVFDAGEDD